MSDAKPARDRAFVDGEMRDAADVDRLACGHTLRGVLRFARFDFAAAVCHFNAARSGHKLAAAMRACDEIVGAR